MEGIQIYKPEYKNSWALIIGIDEYKHVNNLAYATNDANGIAKTLKHSFRFPDGNVTVLLNEQATGVAIREAFMRFSTDDGNVQADDRLLVFFAGHGHTVSGRRGEVGFLVPHDGKLNDLNTLIRWDYLTRNADLITAKHIFYIMDACYGGLVFNRGNRFGTMRFMKDMMQRYTRQALTAGKADEAVSDGNGVRPGHSIFTAHLLNGLDGAAATKEGIITASGIMAYVYEKVGKDQYSRQTPHHGYIDGDGDFIFDLSVVENLIPGSSEFNGRTDEKAGTPDILINAARTIGFAPDEQSPITAELKELLALPERKLRLDDFVSHYVRRFLEATDLRYFPSQPSTTLNLTERVASYEEIAKDLQQISILISKWGNDEQLKQLEKVFIRLAESDKGTSGIVALIELAWYPLMLIIYCSGIAAIANRNYKALKIILETMVQPTTHEGEKPLIVTVMSHITNAHDVFKRLPGEEKKYVPRSEHLFTLLQPMLEDLLFLGRRYEQYFDEFEIFVALSYAVASGDGWGPPGRFAWKHSRAVGISPYSKFVTEAISAGLGWKPLQAGLFGGDFNKFKLQADAYGERLSKLGWW